MESGAWQTRVIAGAHLGHRHDALPTGEAVRVRLQGSMLYSAPSSAHPRSLVSGEMQTRVDNVRWIGGRSLRENHL